MPRKRLTTLNCRPISTKRFYLVSASLYALAILWLLIVSQTIGQTQIVVCPTKLLYHIPCPGCGITRGILMILKGDVVNAIILNPNSLVILLPLFVYPFIVGYDIISSSRITILIYIKYNRVLKNKILLYLLLFFETLVWIHNIFTL